MRGGKLAAILLFLCPAVCTAQQPLDNDAIARMSKAGLSDNLIVTAIHTQPGKYDTSTDGILALKAAGVSDAVVAAIVTKDVAPAPATPSTASVAPSATASPAADADNPEAPHETGFYIYSPKAQGDKMIWVDSTSYKMAVPSSGFFSHPLTANLTGAHADTIVDGSPVTR